VNRNPRDWLLAREADAAARLDQIRRAALAPERATFLESVAEIFRPNLRAWAALAIAWIALVAVHAALSSGSRSPLRATGAQPDLTALATNPDEGLSLLDHHS